MNALHDNPPWPAGRAADATAPAGARRRRTANAAVWTASVLAHAALLALIVSRFAAKPAEPPVVPPIAIEVVAPAKPAPAPALAPPAPPRPSPPPKPVPQRVARPAPPNPRTPVAPAAQAMEHAAPQAPDTAAAPSAPAQPAAPPATAAPIAAPAPEPVTPPIGNAAYLHNPAPRYPQVAQEEGWEGRVVVRVHVDPQGRPASVELRASSGHDVLDKAALAAVRQWTFVPAKRGSEPVDGWADVPLDFRLN